MNKKSRSRNTKQNIIFDSCIIQFAGNKYLSPHLGKYLRTLLESNFLFAISEISYFELFHGATQAQEKELENMLSIFVRYLVDLNALVAASRLGTLYKNLKIPDDQVSVGDKIIGATSILTGSLILTGNPNDFPRPFFLELEVKHIFYKKKNRERMITIHLLRPDYIEIGKRFAERA